MIYRIACLVLGMLLLLPFSQAMAMTPQQQQSLYGDSEYYIPSSICGGSNITNLTGSDNEQMAYNFFISQGLTSIQASAVVGNLMDESHLDPTLIQYPNGGDSNNPADAGSIGWGIAQWTPGGKVIGIAQSLKITTPIYELSTQLNIVWGQMSGTGLTLVQDWVKVLEGMTNLNQATQYFEAELEEGNIANSGITNPTSADGYLLNRESLAAAVYKLYGSSNGNSGSTPSTAGTSLCTSTVANCNNTSGNVSTQPKASSTALETIRQNIVCIAQQELSTWEAQPNYNSPYPQFTYASTGFLKYTSINPPIYEEWCADFASWVYNQAGYPFSGGASGGWRLSGVVGIQQQGVNNPAFQWHLASSGYVPQPGDLAIHYDSSQLNPWVHVNIFISSTGGVSEYIGGDQSGVNEPLYTYGTEAGPNTLASGSVVSKVTAPGYYSNDIKGYVSPN